MLSDTRVIVSRFGEHRLCAAKASGQACPLGVISVVAIACQNPAMGRCSPKADTISKPSYTQDKVVLLCNQRSTTIQDNAKFLPPAPRRIPWNKGKLIGAKPPPRQKHVWAIRTKLQIDRRTRDLALFNLAIDSKLRGCDVVALKVEDVAPNGYSSDRATRPAEKDWATRPV